MNRHDAAARTRYHATDGWRGYDIPPRAIAGASDTGEWDDSPAPTASVTRELEAFKSYLRQHHVKFRTVHSLSSNAFMTKRWITAIDMDSFPRAAQLTVDYLAARPHLAYLHDADLDTLGFTSNDDPAEDTGAVPVTELPDTYFDDVA